MKTRHTLLGAGLALAATALTLSLAFPHHAQAATPQPEKPKKHLLVVTVTKGFRHDSIPVAEQTIQMLGEKTGEWETDFVRTDEDMQAKMTPEALKNYDGIVFANTTGVLPLPDPQGFLDWIKAGHGFAAMHSGSDTFHDWPGGAKGEVSAYADMLGGEFLTHHSQCAISAHVADPKSPALAPIAKAAIPMQSAVGVDLHQHTQAFKNGKNVTLEAFDEIYLLKNNDPSKVHVLLWLDKYPNDGSPDANKPEIHLISWVKSYGTGRVFYTELGHRQEMWRDPLYQAHITGGLEFILGLKKGDTTPSKPLMTAAK
ncbi:MAG TPA: ThuA domain-containing protein [Chthonomonadaceae bacterium]|nr:ThuA domain-containing protein [Chthonomonadaceae bacterium]